MGLILSLDNSIHSFNRAGFVGLLDEYTGAAAGYSLRRLSVNTTNVVRVRRSSDNSEADFTAEEVADGTMTAWVNSDVVKYTSDFTSGNEDLSEQNGVATDGETVDGISDAYKFTLSNGNALHQTIKGGFNSNNLFSISFDYYIPSTNSKVDGILVGFIGGTTSAETTLDSWTTISVNSYNSGGAGNLFFRAREGGNLTIDADGDVFYLKNIVVSKLASNYDATQTTDTSQPKIVDAGVLVEENGKPAVSFDGVDDVFKTASGTSITDKDSQVLIVSSTNAANYIGGLFQEKQISTSFNRTEIWGTTDLSNLRSAVITPTASLDLSLFYASAQSQGQCIITLDNVSDLFSFYRNSILIDSGTKTDNFSDNTELFVGQMRTLYHNGTIQEVILYPSDQSSNRVGIETNINNYYAMYAGSPVGGLLYDYPSSAAAYSLRQLTIYNNGYKETVVRVRRSVDNAEDDFTADEITDGTLLSWVGGQNLLPNSEQFDFFVNNGTTVVANQATAPDASLTADLIYPTVTGNDKRISKPLSIVSGTTYTSSVFLKANGLSWVRFYPAPFTAPASFDVANGVIGTVSSGTTASIEDYGNGWYRCSVTRTATTTGLTGQFYVNLVDGNNSGNVTANGTDGILFWGAQVVEGSEAKPYVKTEANFRW